MNNTSNTQKAELRAWTEMFRQRRTGVLRLAEEAMRAQYAIVTIMAMERLVSRLHTLSCQAPGTHGN